MADLDLLTKQIETDTRLKALQAEIERLAIDNHILRQEVERLTLKLKLETINMIQINMRVP